MISIMGILRFLFFVSLFVVAPGIIIMVVLKNKRKSPNPQPQPQPQQAGKYCPSCGKLINASATFCEGCGAKVDNNQY